MPRTRRRPLPAGEITPGAATGMALFFILTGSLLLSLNGWIPMFLGLLNILFYNLIYTPLKRQSWLAIVPGAVVGGVPPLIGWGSAGAYIFHPKAMFLFIFVSLWQVPHFWLLMIKYGKEYEKAGFQTISRILNEKQIKTVVFCWGVLTSLFLMFFPIFGFYLKPVLLGSLTLTNLFFIGMFYRYLFLQKNAKTIGKAFVLINTYAVAIFVLLIVNSLIS